MMMMMMMKIYEDKDKDKLNITESTTILWIQWILEISNESPFTIRWAIRSPRMELVGSLSLLPWGVIRLRDSLWRLQFCCWNKQTEHTWCFDHISSSDLLSFFQCCFSGNLCVFLKWDNQWHVQKHCSHFVPINLLLLLHHSTFQQHNPGFSTNTSGAKSKNHQGPRYNMMLLSVWATFIVSWCQKKQITRGSASKIQICSESGC